MSRLFYTGTTCTQPGPKDKISDRADAVYKEAWDNKRIGVAIADSPHGPWRRFDAPILEPRPGHWDSVITSNAAPAIHADGFDDTMIDEPKAGVYVTLQNGADWFYPQDGPKAYSLTLDWEDGTTATMDRLERPQVLVQEGAPAYLFLAAKFAGGSAAPNNGIPFNVVLPLRRDEWINRWPSRSDPDSGAAFCL